MVTAYAQGGCGYVYVRWFTGSSEMCRVISSVVILSYYGTGYRLQVQKVKNSTFYTFTGLSSDTSYAVKVHVSSTENVTSADPSHSTYARTMDLEGSYVTVLIQFIAI